MTLRVLAALLALTTTAAAQRPQRPLPAPGQVPHLLVFITVDQMRGDYLERFGPQLTGGLHRLAAGGAWFTNAFQDHALTETAPGHATTMAGRFPSHTGIVSNNRGVPDRQAPLVDARGPGASPYRFRGTTLFDWLRFHDARSRALSVSRKDRAAILPMGRTHQAVYWYADEGKFTTSTYYADTLPAWIKAFNARELPQKAAGWSWTPLLADSAYPEADAQPWENGGRANTFPHVLPADSDAAARQLPWFPIMDQVTLDLALDGVTQRNLGRGPAPDVLAISLSATDYIGHRYGPDSRELHDQIVRLDRALGSFIDSLYRLRDSSTIIFALTADHGVQSYPAAYTQPTGKPAATVSLGGIARAIRHDLATRGADSTAVRLDEAMLWVDRAALERAHIDPDSLDRAFATAARARGVRADLVRDLTHADTVHDAVARRWLHQLPPDAPVDVVVTPPEHSVWGDGIEAQHGTPWDDDAWVPVVFYGPPFKAGHYATFTRVVDMAPTLAWVLAVKPAEALDGHVLWEGMK